LNEKKNHILFVGKGDKVDSIKEYASKYSNIHYSSFVPPEEVVSFIAGADVGMCTVENISLSDYYCLPNKLFEYLLAGIPVFINDFPDQRALVAKYDCGWVLPEFPHDIATLFNRLNREVLTSKHNGVKRAQQDLSWENEEAAYLDVVNELSART